LSYDKRASVLSAHLKKLRNVIGNNTLYSWAAAGAANIVETTGSAVGGVNAPSATGNRNAIAFADISNANAILDGQDLNPADDRYLILPAGLYWQLMRDSAIQKHLEWGGSAVSPTGKLPMVAGCKIISRSSVVVYDNTGTPVIKTINDEGTPSSPAATDNLGALLISSSYVSKALGEIKVFANDNVAEFYGDILSAVVCHGSAKLRTNAEGIVAIVQQ
jgi:hypothetical protein